MLVKIVEFPESCIKIKEYLYKKGVDVTLYEAEDLWESFSRTRGTYWLFEIDNELDSFFEYITRE